jgi:hypothetical protein
MTKKSWGRILHPAPLGLIPNVRDSVAERVVLNLPSHRPVPTFNREGLMLCELSAWRFMPQHGILLYTEVIELRGFRINSKVTIEGVLIHSFPFEQGVLLHVLHA